MIININAKINKTIFPFDMALLFWYIRAEVLLLMPKGVAPIQVANLLFFRMVKYCTPLV